MKATLLIKAEQCVFKVSGSLYRTYNFTTPEIMLEKLPFYKYLSTSIREVTIDALPAQQLILKSLKKDILHHSAPQTDIMLYSNRRNIPLLLQIFCKK